MYSCFNSFCFSFFYSSLIDLKGSKLACEVDELSRKLEALKETVKQLRSQREKC